MRAIDLFCGTGAFTTAMKDLGIEVVFASDIKPESKMMYEKNHPGERFHCGDINDLDVKDIPQHDLLTAGFPCVSFSSLGNRQGFKDPRARTIDKVVEIAGHHLPAMIVIENVRNLLSHDNGAAYAHIRQQFEALGYTVKSVVLDTAKHSLLPHHRERLYITCLRSAEAAAMLDMEYPKIVARPFRDFLEPTVPEKYYYSDRYKCYPLLEKTIVREDRLYQMRHFKGGYVRELKILPTFTGGFGTGGHQVPLFLDKGRIRKFMPRELYSLQGFPTTHNIDGHSDTRLNVLIGNSVSIPIVRQVIQHGVLAMKKSRP